MPVVGDELAGYRLEELIGRGGMGTVFRAEHVALSRKAAVKVMNPSVAADDRFRARFKREARLAAALDHPNIVPVYDAGESGEHLYIAMRYVEGTDLSALLERGRLEPSRVADIVAQVAGALDAAHRRGLVHRDVKPAYVLLRADPDDPEGVPHAFLTDFGITRDTANTQDLTATGAFIGSVQYAAPEQIATGAATPATDIYALGCLTYEALTGEAPFRRDHDVATLWAHVNDPVEPLTTRLKGVAPELDAAVQRALAKDPAARWPTCSSFASALRAAVSTGGATFVDEPVPREPQAAVAARHADGGDVTVPPPAQGTATDRRRLRERAAPTPVVATGGGPPAVFGAQASSGAGSRPARGLQVRAAGAVVVLLAAGAAGVAVAGGRGHGPATAIASSAVKLTLPASSAPRSSASLPDLPGLQLAGPVAAAQVSESLVRAGHLKDPGSPPDPLSASFTGTDSVRSIVRLPAGEAFRYDQRRGGGLRRTFALATGKNAWIVLSCEAPRVARAEDCDTAAVGLELRSGRAIPLSPERQFATSLAAERRVLTAARERQRQRVRAGAAAGRERAARVLSQAHRAAALALAKASPPTIAGPAVAAERAALGRLGSAFAALGAAAGADDRPAFNRARGDVSTAEAALERAQSRLTRLGYGR